MRRLNRRILAAALVGFATVIGLAQFWYRRLDDLARGHERPIRMLLLEEMSGAYASLLVFVLVGVIVYRFPVTRENWRRRVPAYALVVVLAGALITTLMWGARVLISPLLGLGPYDYGLMRWRYPMEFATQGPVLTLYIVLLHWWRAWRRADARALRTAQLEAELQSARLQGLQAQLQPHFLFNTLNAISALTYSDPAAADRMIGQLSELLRRSFEASPEPEHPLSVELDWLGDYLDIMLVRFGSRMCVRRDIDPGTLACMVPRLLLQPVVENAIQHGIARRAGPGTIELAATRNAGRLILEVRDDGPGLGASGAESNGVGLANTRARLHALYGAAGTLAISGRPEGGTVVTLSIPLESQA